MQRTLPVLSQCLRIRHPTHLRCLPGLQFIPHTCSRPVAAIYGSNQFPFHERSLAARAITVTVNCRYAHSHAAFTRPTLAKLVASAKLGDTDAQVELGRRLLAPAESKDEAIVRELMERSLIDLSGRPTGGAGSAVEVMQEVRAQLKRPKRKRKRKKREVKEGANGGDEEVEEDDAAAEEWLRKAADAGSLEAFVELGKLYIRVLHERGEALSAEEKSQCFQEAIRCLTRVVEHGKQWNGDHAVVVETNESQDDWRGVLRRHEAEVVSMPDSASGLTVIGAALFHLGNLHYDGVEGLLLADPAKAVELIAEAAVRCRDPAAMFWIGHVGLTEAFTSGNDRALSKQEHLIPKREEGFAFVKEAADAGHSGAQVYIFKFLCSLEDDADDSEGGQDQVEEDLRALGLAGMNTAEMAMDYLGRAVETLEPEALYLQADLLLGQDNPRALALYVGAGSGGIAQAWVNAGAMFYDGLGTEQDYIKAFLAYEKGALLGSVGAWTNIASMYFNGEAVPQCQNTARKLIQLLPEQGKDPTLKVSLESVLKLRAICEESIVSQ